MAKKKKKKVVKKASESREILQTGKIRLFKVLRRTGRLLTGGHSSFDYTPYLPTDTAPGQWLPIRRPLSMCNVGWHVTAHPYHWNGAFTNARVFEVQVRGPIRGNVNPSKFESSHKICCQQIRLMKEIKRNPPPAPPPPPTEWDKIVSPTFQQA